MDTSNKFQILDRQTEEDIRTSEDKIVVQEIGQGKQDMQNKFNTKKWVEEIFSKDSGGQTDAFYNKEDEKDGSGTPTNINPMKSQQ